MTTLAEIAYCQGCGRALRWIDMALTGELIRCAECQRRQQVTARLKG